MNEATWRRLSCILIVSLVAVAAQIVQIVANQAISESACGRRCVLVEVMLVKSQTYAPKITLTGAIEPRFSSNIAFRINGKINERLVEIGDQVAADQVLARLDPQVQRASLDSAKAVLISAQALLTQATATFERQAQLLKNGYATRQSYDQAQQQVRTEEAAVESAQAATSTAEEQLGYAELKAGVAGIITARGAETG